MATTTVASLLALVERPDSWAHIACNLGGDELWRARRVNRGLRSACEAELARLRELSLVRYYRKVDDVVLREVAARCTQLNYLNLSVCHSVTDEGLRAVAAACTQLTSLNLCDCRSVTDEGLRAVAAACTQLTSLNLTWCRLVTDEGLRAVAAACTQLTSLDLSGCTRLTDRRLRGEA
jgi:bacterioferritin-associated ferredoxin